jgi:ribosome-associated protein
MSRQPNTLEIEQLEAIVMDALDDMKAQDVTVLNTESLTDEFDRVIIATATSNRQTRALANNVHEKVKDNGGDVLSTEGEDTGEWVLVDCGDIVVHIMQAPIRAYYNLEELWDPSK